MILTFWLERLEQVYLRRQKEKRRDGQPAVLRQYEQFLGMRSSSLWSILTLKIFFFVLLLSEKHVLTGFYFRAQAVFFIVLLIYF